jgi:hypothetical protein
LMCRSVRVQADLPRLDFRQFARQSLRTRPKSTIASSCSDSTILGQRSNASVKRRRMPGPTILDRIDAIAT